MGRSPTLSFKPQKTTAEEKTRKAQILWREWEELWILPRWGGGDLQNPEFSSASQILLSWFNSRARWAALVFLCGGPAQYIRTCALEEGALLGRDGWTEGPEQTAHPRIKRNTNVPRIFPPRYGRYVSSPSGIQPGAALNTRVRRQSRVQFL